MSQSPFVVALDYPHIAAAREMVASLEPSLCRLKLGQQLFAVAGPDFLRELSAAGFEVFLDAKYHDIPATVAGACQAAAEAGAWMVNIHAQGGRRMMEAAVNSLASYRRRPLLIAVTVLTSLEAVDLHDLGHVEGPDTLVMRLATMALAAGCDGLVCSVHEVAALRGHFGRRPLLVTPGIRLPGEASDEQRRIATPTQALDAGADYVVLGRSLRRAPDPAAKLRALLSSLSG